MWKNVLDESGTISRGMYFDHIVFILSENERKPRRFIIFFIKLYNFFLYNSFNYFAYKSIKVTDIKIHTHTLFIY